MAFQSSTIIITTLILLYIGCCSAIFNGLDLETNEWGIKITSANCNGKEYRVEELYQAVGKGMEILRNRVESQISDKDMHYEAVAEEDFPFSPPYYFYPLNVIPRPMKYGYQEDFVIFTSDGKLVTVFFVPCNRYGSNLRSKFDHHDCVLVPPKPSSNMDPHSKWQAGDSHGKRRKIP